MTGQQLLMVGLGTGCAIMACLFSGPFILILGLYGGVAAGLQFIGAYYV